LVNSERIKEMKKKGMVTLMKNMNLQKLVLTGLFAALSYVVFTFL